MWISRKEYDAMKADYTRLLEHQVEVVDALLSTAEKYHNHYVATRGHMKGIERLRRKVKRLEDENLRLQGLMNWEYAQDDDAISVALRAAEAL